MKENIEILDFDSGAEEFQEIEKLDVGHSLFGWW